MKSPQSFVFIGRSGCGKGTQAKLLIDHLKMVDPTRTCLYIQTGAEFREFIKGDSYTQEISKKIFQTGALVPEFLAVYFWANKIIKNFTSKEHLVCDGMPRKYHEAAVLESLFDFYDMKRPHIMYLNVSESWAKGRLMERHRIDDTRQEIENRLAWFNTNVLPTVEYYRKNSLYAFHDIDAERSIAEIHVEIRSFIDAA